jgi:tRNA threonylcarbamoyladenosine biosynthesis protein TsaE
MATGGRLAQAIRDRGIEALVIYLIGDLGAGKTTFARGFLRGLGHEGRVPSPTYTLIEPYELAGYAVSHIDLYRLQSPGEAGALALEELGGCGTIMLIEWPEKGGSSVPPADLEIRLEIGPRGRTLGLDGCPAVTDLTFFAKK